ncbi:protein disulfide-isomerase precursor [Pleurotus ostreatus]|uniref:protein disulfide-isomerase n=1 Tax=Pleurotus ostreatus TaxID=5322 RepID=A0A8H7DR06_PLEOS|nr:protein disulfide-isomerase precursor [Pleurotus ostreatus]KAF7422218.1 protein disulfide-isomerase precursor [Pleurotus ostreatus]KAJ8691992.1 protein disulfide-isomerase precursor [Pleurotus ostreatus]
MHPRSLVSPGTALVVVSLAVASSASDIISLTASSFDTVVPSESLILLRFCTPWSSHCKALTPHYEQAATLLKAYNIKIADVDCVEEPDLCEVHQARGYPYMLDQSLPAVSEITAANHAEFQQQAAHNKKAVAIAYLSSPTGPPADAFGAVAQKLRDSSYLFGLSTDDDAIAAAGVTPPAIVAYRSFDDPKTPCPLPVSRATAAELEEWITGLSVPLIAELGAENYHSYAISPKYLASLFLDPSDPQKDARLEAMRPVARKYRSRVNFVWIDAVEFREHARALNLKDAKWPAFVIQDFGRQQRTYALDQRVDITPASVEDWVRQLLEGQLDPPLKSAPIPEAQDGPVFTLVGQQFDEIVFDDSKDVFLALYTTWCGHCKRMHAAWDALGAKYAALTDRITIAKMEMAANELPASAPFRVAGFPTIKFKRAGTRTFIDYARPRTLEDFVAFVEEHAANSLAPVVPAGAEGGQIRLGVER